MTARDLALVPIKACRNLVADAAASMVARHPRLEPAYVAVGKQLRKLPWLSTLYRRATETLTARLRRDGLAHRKVTIGPFQPVFDVSEFTAGGLYFLDIPYEPKTTGWLLSRLRPGATFVDVGANHGYLTVLAALAVGATGRVLAFEPNPTVYAQLEDHLRRNDVSERVTTAQVALSNAAGTDVAFFPSLCASNSGLSSFFPSAVVRERGMVDSASIAVLTDTWDGWADREGVGRVDGVKIDVEGAEELVLAGMQRTLATAPPHWIVCETAVDSPAHRRLVAAGYRMSLLDCTHDGFGNLLFTRDEPA